MEGLQQVKLAGGWAGGQWCLPCDILVCGVCWFDSTTPFGVTEHWAEPRRGKMLSLGHLSNLDAVLPGGKYFPLLAGDGGTSQCTLVE